MRALVLSVVALLVAACGGAGSGGPSPTPGPPLGTAELKYRLIDELGRPAFCDPDFYPIAREDETSLAAARFPEIERDAETLGAILAHERFAMPAIYPPPTFSPEQRLLIYRQWKLLSAVQLQGPGAFSVRVFTKSPPAKGEDVTLVEGTIDVAGRISVARRSSTGPLMCPICLAAGTRIATPSGDMAVESLRAGDVVWTQGARGERVAAAIVRVGSVAVVDHRVVDLALADGRRLRASPGHPTADGRRLGDLRPGDTLDDSTVVRAELLRYSGARTYDLRPAGASGAYWAGGILLLSTLRQE
jgi:hypothetical protein